jgi:hypothetical protein
LALQRDVAREESVERLSEIESLRRQSVEEFNRWEQEQLQPTLNKASNRLVRARRNTTDQIDELLNPSGQLLLHFVEKQSGKSGSEIAAQAGMIQQDFTELWGIAIGRIFENFKLEFGDTCAEVTQTLGAESTSYDISKEINSAVDVNYRKVESLSMSASSGFESARNMMFGGIAGFTLVNIASLAFPPLAAFNLLYIAAATYGVAEAKRIADEKRKDEALSRLRSLLCEQLSQIRRSVIRHFEDKADDCSKSLQDIFKSATLQTKQDLDRRLTESKNASTRTKEEAKSLVDSIEKNLRQVDTAIKQLSLKFNPTRA